MSMTKIRIRPLTTTAKLLVSVLATAALSGCVMNTHSQERARQAAETAKMKERYAVERQQMHERRAADSRERDRRRAEEQAKWAEVRKKLPCDYPKLLGPAIGPFDNWTISHDLKDIEDRLAADPLRCQIGGRDDGLCTGHYWGRKQPVKITGIGNEEFIYIQIPLQLDRGSTIAILVTKTLYLKCT